MSAVWQGLDEAGGVLIMKWVLVFVLSISFGSCASNINGAIMRDQGFTVVGYYSEKYPHRKEELERLQERLVYVESAWRQRKILERVRGIVREETEDARGY